MLIVRTKSQIDSSNLFLDGGVFTVSEKEWSYFIEKAKTSNNTFINELISNATIYTLVQKNIIEFIKMINFTAPIDYLRNTFPVKIPEIIEVPYDRPAEIAKIIRQAEKLIKRDKKREGLSIKKSDSGWKVVGSKK